MLQQDLLFNPFDIIPKSGFFSLVDATCYVYRKTRLAKTELHFKVKICLNLILKLCIFPGGNPINEIKSKKD